MSKTTIKGPRKRTDLELIRDRRIVMRMLKENRTIVEITATLNSREDVGYTLTKAQIALDQRRILEEVAALDYNEHKRNVNQQMAKLKELEGLMWREMNSWSSKHELDPEGAGPINQSLAASIVSVVKEQNRILGVYAPKKKIKLESMTFNVYEDIPHTDVTPDNGSGGSDQLQQ